VRSETTPNISHVGSQNKVKVEKKKKETGIATDL
jgi:hypothetical protein